MKAKELKERGTEDLVQLREQLRGDLFSYKMKNSLGQLDDTSQIQKKRRDVARIEGILQGRKAEATAQMVSKGPAAGSKS
jgi:large subunit ribosomal protein L29